MSGRVTAGMVQRSILTDLNGIDARLARTQERAASGKQITRPSDDPFDAARAMALRSDLAANAQHQRNAQAAMDWHDTTETALASITDAVQRAQDLVTQGASDGADQASRDAIAGELEQLLASIKQDANATHGGAYVFGGASTTSPPYADGNDDTYHGDRAGAVPPLAGDPPTGLLRQIGPGVTVSINVVGSDVIGSGGSDGKLLSVLRATISHLRAGDGAALRDTDLGALQANLDTVLAVRARNGAQANRLESALTRLQQTSEVATKQLSDTEDADIAKTLIDLNSQSAAYQAALRSGATIIQSSLMDFLR